MLYYLYYLYKSDDVLKNGQLIKEHRGRQAVVLGGLINL